MIYKSNMFAFLLFYLSCSSSNALVTSVAQSIKNSPSRSSTSKCDSVFPQLPGSIEIKNQHDCENAGLCWSTSKASCFFPNIIGYEIDAIDIANANHIAAKLSLIEPSGALGPDIPSLSFDIRKETKDRTHLRITSSEGNRWEIPNDIIPRESNIIYFGHNASSEIIMTNKSPLEVTVKSNQNVIFSLSEMLVFQDQYIEVVLNKPDNVMQVYGIGESSRLQQSLEFSDSTSYVLWNTDYWAAGFNQSLYGSHPFYIQIYEDGTASGVLLMNSNAMNVQLARSDNEENDDKISFQIAGGIIDFYLFSGPTPADVIKQYQEIVGKPSLIPYWALGFHNCRWGYSDLNYVKDVVANYSNANIPLETQWMDIDYMQNYLDFTTDAVRFPIDEMKTFINSLHENDQHFIPIVDPGIYAIPAKDGEVPYQAQVQGLEQNVFVKDLQGSPYIGEVWPGSTYFPDWFASNTTSYWLKQLSAFHEDVQFDGIWIDMNEVSNFCNVNGVGQVCSFACACSTVDTNNVYDFPPWVPAVPQGSLGGKTLPMSAVHAGGIAEYNAHNLYGLMESIATQSAVAEITSQRPFVLSRSTFLSSGKHTAHWTGDNAATWDDLKVSIITMNNMAMFGISVTGADICGFVDDTTEELCARWAQVGAFSTFMRNHNSFDSSPQEFYRWESVANISRAMINIRYSLLPHLYTLLFNAYKTGATVHNALWTHYSNDPVTLTPACDGQYMWSNDILFTPVLTEQAVSVTGYFPRGLWYPLLGNTSNTIDTESTGGRWVTLETPLNSTNIHVRGGTIVTMQQPAMTTAKARLTPMSLLIALDSKKTAKGSLFVDDGVQHEVESYTIADFLVSFDDTVREHKLESSTSTTAPANIAGPIHPSNINTKLSMITVMDLKNDSTFNDSPADIVIATLRLYKSESNSPASRMLADNAEDFLIKGAVSRAKVGETISRKVVFDLADNGLVIDLTKDNFQIIWK